MNLKKERKDIGATQIKLAAEVGVSLNTIILWENGISTPTEENQQKLEEALERLKQKK